MKKKIRNDIILISVLLALALSLFLLTAFADKAQAVEITVDGELYGVYRTDIEKKIDINGTNTLVIKDGGVYMQSACCENNTCVKQGRITKVGQSIICLPNRVTVTLVDGKGIIADTEYYTKKDG